MHAPGCGWEERHEVVGVPCDARHEEKKHMSFMSITPAADGPEKRHPPMGSCFPGRVESAAPRAVAPESRIWWLKHSPSVSEAANDSLRPVHGPPDPALALALGHVVPTARVRTVTEIDRVDQHPVVRGVEGWVAQTLDHALVQDVAKRTEPVVRAQRREHFPAVHDA